MILSIFFLSFKSLILLDNTKKETVSTMEEDEKLAQALQYEMDRDYALAVRV